MGYSGWKYDHKTREEVVGNSIFIWYIPFMHKDFKYLIAVLVLINVFFCSWYVLNSDIHFSSDIARDFFLYQEIADKKIMLLGPRSSTAGLFHGPLWEYLNFPVFVIGKGNPLVLGWYWIFMIVGFLSMSFYIAKKLFNEQTAYVYVLLLSQLMIFHAAGLFNPHGALFLMPLFFFLFILYNKTKKFIYLLLHLFVAGLIVQFQMAIGIPFLFLSTIYIFVNIIKNKKFHHVLAFSILIIPLSTFIAFDLKHDFIQLKAATSFASSDSAGQSFNYLTQIGNRINLAVGGLQVYDGSEFSDPAIVLLLFIYVFMLIYLQIKENKYKEIYLSFLYFYFGYILLSLFNKGAPLYHQFFPIFSLTALIFVSLLNSKYLKVFLIIFAIVYLHNFYAVSTYIEKSNAIIGKSFESWKFLSSMAKTIYDGSDKTFGYFVFTPDSVGYAPKYAMKYYGGLSPKQTHYFQKKKITYITVEPPAINNPYATEESWKKDKLHLTRKPDITIELSDGYMIEKYILTKDEQEIPADSDIDPGLHYR